MQTLLFFTDTIKGSRGLPGTKITDFHNVFRMNNSLSRTMRFFRLDIVGNAQFEEIIHWDGKL